MAGRRAVDRRVTSLGISAEGGPGGDGAARVAEGDARRGGVAGARAARGRVPGAHAAPVRAGPARAAAARHRLPRLQPAEPQLVRLQPAGARPQPAEPRHGAHALAARRARLVRAVAGVDARLAVGGQAAAVLREHAPGRAGRVRHRPRLARPVAGSLGPLLVRVFDGLLRASV